MKVVECPLCLFEHLGLVMVDFVKIYVRFDPGGNASLSGPKV